MKKIKETNIHKPIIMTMILDNDNLVVVDKNTTIRFMDKDSLKVLSGFKVNIDHERYKHSVVSFTSTGSHFATLTADCKEARLFNAKTKKNVAKMTRHQGEVACVKIDPLNRYMFSGGEDGKTFAVDLKTGKLAFTLPHHADTINDIAFSSNGNWAVTVSYDRKVGVFNLATMMQKHKLKAHSDPVMHAAFINISRFVTIDKKSSAIVWDTYNGKILARLKGIHDDVRSIAVSGDERFLFLGSELGHIMVYDLENYELMARSFLKFSSTVTALMFDDENNNLIVSTDGGELSYYNVFEGEADLKPLLQSKKYADMYKKVDENPFLAYTSTFKLVDEIWDKTLHKVKKLLEKSQKEKAVALLEHFKSIPSKNSYIQILVKNYAEFDKFVNAAKQGKLTLAYSMANVAPVFKETSVYAALEKKWKQDFLKAQKLALNPKGLQQAKDILASYRGIPDKTKLIQELLAEANVYKRFRETITNKKFRMVYELVKRYPFLKEFPEFEVVENYGMTLYAKAQMLIKSDDTNHALKVLGMLTEFSGFAEEAEQIRTDIENKLKFDEAIKENDIAKAYKYLDQSDDLQETEEGKKLFQKWSDDYSKAEVCAAKADVNGIKTALRSYMNIPSKSSSIGTVFAWCYITQLEKAVRERKEKSYIEQGIKNYILNFGLRDEIQSFYDIFVMYYKDSKLNLEMLHSGSMEMWKPSMIVDTIFEED